MPYSVGVRWFEFALYSSGVVILAFIVFDGIRRSWRTTSPMIFWIDFILLGFFLSVMFGAVFKKVIFSESEIQYHIFWIDRRYRYETLRSIRPVSKYNRNARFVFDGGESFRAALAYLDADCLMEILRDRAPCVLPDLAILRDALTPPGMRMSS
jgi:hypothetical protein